MDSGLKKGIAVVFLANIINLSLSLIRNFLLPKYLGIDTYAEIKSYQLYISYAGLVALGYIDGMYLKYGGKNNDEIDINAFNRNLSTFRILQISISMLITIAGVVCKSWMIVAVGLSIVAINIPDYYKCYYQATGEFSRYSRIMNVSSILMFSVNIGLLLIGCYDDSSLYIFGYIAVYYIIWIALEINANRKRRIQLFTFSSEELKVSIGSGFFLMCGLLLSNFMTGMDRWFIKFTLDNYAFAAYSFAAGIEGFLSYAISPISITLYNFFCREKSDSVINAIRRKIQIFAAFLMTMAFPVKFIMETYLDKYYSAYIVLFILFAGQIIYALIRCFYINLYKAEKKQTIYFKKIIIVVVAGFVLNVILFCLLRRMEAFAIGTMLSAIVWLILCINDFKRFKLELKDIIYITVSVVSLLVTGLFLKSYYGIAVYLLIIGTASFTLLKSDMYGLIGIGTGYLGAKFKRRQK